MRIGSKLFHNLDNEQIVIMDESTGNEVALSINEAKELFKFLFNNLPRSVPK